MAEKRVRTWPEITGSLIGLWFAVLFLGAMVILLARVLLWFWKITGPLFD